MADSSSSVKSKRKVSANQTAEGLRQLEADQTEALRKAQMQYIWKRMHDTPSLIPALISMVDGVICKKTDFFPECVRRFEKIKKDRCMEIVHHVAPRTKAWSFEDETIEGMRDLVCYLLGVRPSDKIPGRTSEESFYSWVDPRVTAVGPREHTLLLVSGRIDWKFSTGAYSFVLPDGPFPKQISKVKRNSTGEEADLPFGVVFQVVSVTAETEWTIINNYSEELADLKREGHRQSASLAELFGTECYEKSLEDVGAAITRMQAESPPAASDARSPGFTFPALMDGGAGALLQSPSKSCDASLQLLSPPSKRAPKPPSCKKAKVAPAAPPE